MVVQHNISGMNANRQLNITTGIQAKSSEKLSSGYKINRAADDAAGLAISEKMRRQVRGLTQASKNSQDGVSWCQIADGALDEVSNMLARAKELSIQAANDTLQDTDRGYINEEMQKIAAEIDRTHASTEFNNIHVFTDDGYAPAGANKSESDNVLSLTLPNGTTVDISLEFVGIDGTKQEVQKSSAAGQDTSYANSDFAKFVKNAAADAVNNLFGSNGIYKDLFTAAGSPNIQVGLRLAPGGEGGTLATASLSMSYNSTSSVMSYTMYVDTSDYPLSDFSNMSDEKKSNLAATIAHEMTHLVMYDTLTDGMLSGFPLWFKEGVAQGSSGDNGWVKYGPDGHSGITASSSPGVIKNYMSKLDSMEYGAGYLAAMYLGYAVSAQDGNKSVTSDNIANGLEKLMTYMATNKVDLNSAIHDLTGYNNVSDFESHFKTGTVKTTIADDGPLSFVQSFLSVRGTNGAGSLFGNLGDSETTVFKNSYPDSSSGNYAINTDNTSYANAFGSGYVMPEKQSGIATGEGVSDGLGKDLYLQVGSETSSQNQIALKRFNISMLSLGEGKTFDTTTRENALLTIETVNVAGQNVSMVRSYYGAMQNRLEHTIRNLDNVVENTQAAESLIRDTDMAEEMVRYSNNNILAQAGQAMLAQANQTNQGVLSLLQ